MVPARQDKEDSGVSPVRARSATMEASPGVEAFVSYHPATGHTLVVLSNYYDSALPLMEAFPKEFSKRRACGEQR